VRGVLPSHPQVLHHTCGNKECCNPKHLEVVTKAWHNLTHKGTKLTPEEVHLIRRLRSHGHTHRAIRETLHGKVGMTQIHRICSGRSWKEPG
jgi:hypothetical protein